MEALKALLTSLARNAVRLVIGTGEGLFVQDEGCGIPEEEIRRAMSGNLCRCHIQHGF